jgi:hypothetical protein
MNEIYPTQRALELACAAQRINKGYIKEPVVKYGDNNEVLYTTYCNRDLVLFNLKNPLIPVTAIAPMRLVITEEDREMVTDIRKYFRKLVFSAVKNDDDFWTQLNVILTLDEVPSNRIGFVACLPQSYIRDYAKTRMEKIVKDLTQEHYGLIGDELLDKDCEILDIRRSKNFDAWNICAIIDNKMVSWMSRNELKPGACVLIKGKVKDHSLHWKYQCPETRLNYVKAFQ